MSICKRRSAENSTGRGARTLAAGAGTRRGSAGALALLIENRRKLLELHYAGQVSAALFANEEARLTSQIDALNADESAAAVEGAQQASVQARFEQVAAYLAEVDVPTLWGLCALMCGGV